MTTENKTAIAARCLMALLFLVAGTKKVLAWSASVAYFQKLGIPAAELVLALTVLIEVGGGLALVAGWKLNPVALVMATFTFAAAFLGHAFWAADGAQFNGQLNNFLKNMAMTGGFLLIAAEARRNTQYNLDSKGASRTAIQDR